MEFLIIILGTCWSESRSVCMYVYVWYIYDFCDRFCQLHD